MTDPRHGARSALIILFAINLLNFFDRNMFGAVAEPIRKEWALNDSQIGWLATAFILLYAFVGVPLGRLSDRWNRPQNPRYRRRGVELANGSFRNGLELRDTIRGQSGRGNRRGKLRPRIEFTHR